MLEQPELSLGECFCGWKCHGEWPNWSYGPETYTWSNRLLI